MSEMRWIKVVCNPAYVSDCGTWQIVKIGSVWRLHERKDEKNVHRNSYRTIGDAKSGAEYWSGLRRYFANRSAVSAKNQSSGRQSIVTAGFPRNVML